MVRTYYVVIHIDIDYLSRLQYASQEFGSKHSNYPEDRKQLCLLFDLLLHMDCDTAKGCRRFSSSRLPYGLFYSFKQERPLIFINVLHKSLAHLRGYHEQVSCQPVTYCLPSGNLSSSALLSAGDSRMSLGMVLSQIYSKFSSTLTIFNLDTLFNIN
jgi:hypothetical protein